MDNSIVLIEWNPPFFAAPDYALVYCKSLLHVALYNFGQNLICPAGPGGARQRAGNDYCLWGEQQTAISAGEQLACRDPSVSLYSSPRITVASIQAIILRRNCRSKTFLTFWPNFYEIF